VLALDIASDRIYSFTGDVASMMLLLRDGQASSVEILRKRLARKRPTFAKNRFQLECIEEALSYLRKIDFLDVHAGPSVQLRHHRKGCAGTAGGDVHKHFQADFPII